MVIKSIGVNFSLKVLEDIRDVEINLGMDPLLEGIYENSLDYTDLT